MCGIAGVFSYRSDTEVSEGVLHAMAASIRHRGPDEDGFYRDPSRSLGFAFRRLSIVDLAGGSQPMTTPDGRFWIVFNGEIYNHLELRRRLEDKGRRFRTRCDTEVVLESYAEEGAACVESLQGMFAFAIWDNRERELFLARDRIGIKPLYYADRDGQFVFGSEIKALFEHPAFSPELNREQLGTYLTFLSIPAPDTLFRGVSKLRAGHTLTVKAEGGPGAPRRYWTPLAGDGTSGSEEELAGELRSLLTDSVKCRLMSDVPFGAFLSGGIDSSSIVAIMAGALDQPVKTFNVGYKSDPDFNETRNARRTAELFGTEHHEILIDHRDFKAFLPRLVHHQDEPIADPVCVPLYYVAELARKNGVVVTLVGEGSDELFFGYDFHNRIWNMVDSLWNPMRRMPGPVRSLATRTASLFVDVQRKDFLRRLRVGGEPFLGGAVAFYPDELARLAPGVGRSGLEASVDRFYAEIDAVRPRADFPARAGYLELMHRLPELLLMRVDKMTMAASVEGRVPFLDHRLVEWALRVPARLKVKNGERKYILKQAVRGLIPDEIIDRPKVGFHVPVTHWFEEVLSPLADDALRGPGMRELKIWDDKAVERLLSLQRRGRGNYGMRIWALVNFALWYRHWFRGERF